METIELRNLILDEVELIREGFEAPWQGGNLKYPTNATEYVHAISKEIASYRNFDVPVQAKVDLCIIEKELKDAVTYYTTCSSEEEPSLAEYIMDLCQDVAAAFPGVWGDSESLSDMMNNALQVNIVALQDLNGCLLDLAIPILKILSGSKAGGFKYFKKYKDYEATLNAEVDKWSVVNNTELDRMYLDIVSENEPYEDDSVKGLRIELDLPLKTDTLGNEIVARIAEAGKDILAQYGIKLDTTPVQKAQLAYDNATELTEEHGQ